MADTETDGIEMEMEMEERMDDEMRIRRTREAIQTKSNLLKGPNVVLRVVVTGIFYRTVRIEIKSKPIRLTKSVLNVVKRDISNGNVEVAK